MLSVYSQSGWNRSAWITNIHHEVFRKVSGLVELVVLIKRLFKWSLLGYTNSKNCKYSAALNKYFV